MWKAVVEPVLGSQTLVILPTYPFRDCTHPLPWNRQNGSTILIHNFNVEVTVGLGQITSRRFKPYEHSRHHQRNAVGRLQARNIQAAWIFQATKLGPDVNVIGRHGYNIVAKEAPLVRRS
jgi:hypothetical protein